jgi:hypothetical protein
VPKLQPALAQTGQTVGWPSSFTLTELPGSLFISTSSFYTRPYVPSKQRVMPTYAPTQVELVIRWRSSFGRSIVTDKKPGPMF